MLVIPAPTVFQFSYFKCPRHFLCLRHSSSTSGTRWTQPAHKKDAANPPSYIVKANIPENPQIYTVKFKTKLTHSNKLKTQMCNIQRLKDKHFDPIKNVKQTFFGQLLLYH